MTTAEQVDSTAVDLGTDLVPVEHQSATLFRTDDPAEVVVRATAVADALKGVLDRQGLTAVIQGRKHVLVEGWTTLGTMLGVTPVSVWTHPVEGDAPAGKVWGWEAKVEARTLDGRVIGSAEAMCTRSESTWKNRDDYALRSMAQTRATSKALRAPLGFIVTLAGYQATPAEEMPADVSVATPVEVGPPCAPERAAEIGLIITDALQRGLDPSKLPTVFTAAGASPEAINAEAVAALTAKQADAVEDSIAELLAQTA